jgi:hypothetical protein
MARAANPLILVVLLSGWELTPWQNWVYPHPDDERASISLTGFRLSSNAKKRLAPNSAACPVLTKGATSADACRWDETSLTNICEEIRR